MKRSPPYTLANLKPLFRGRLPGQLVIQYSNRCNADCPQCGMRRTNRIQRHTLAKDQVMKLIDNGAAKGVKSLSFTGGEPLLFLDDIVEMTAYATAAGIPYVRTGTNGFIFRRPDLPDFSDRVKRVAEKLASTKLYTFWISLDSAIPEDHERLRGLPGVVAGIEKALPIFHQYGIFPAVNLGINRATGGSANQPQLNPEEPEAFLEAFREAFKRFYQLAADLGFTMVNACYPMSDAGGDQECSPDEETATPESGSLYGASSSDSLVRFCRREKALIFRALFETIPKFRGTLRIFSPRCSLYGLIRKFDRSGEPLFTCRGGSDFFFVGCRDGLIHPCGFREEGNRELPDLICRTAKLTPCDLCEWECFRDPSDVLGPFAEAFSAPFKLARKLTRDPRFFGLLLEDLRYYRACSYFNGRLAPEFQAMRRFERT